MTTRRPSEDLFEESRMSFGEHLEELRGTLVRSLMGIGLGCVIGFLVAHHVVSFLKGPLDKALDKFRIQQANSAYIDRLGYFPPEMEERMRADRLAPQTVFVDPGQLIAVLKTVSPDSFAKIDLTPYRFDISSVQLQDTSDVCRVMVDPEDAEETVLPMASAINQVLTESERSILRSIADSAEASEDQRQQLVSILNAVIDRPQLHQSDAFDPWLEQPGWSIWHLFDKPKDNSLAQMKQVVEQRRDPNDSRRLNRLLVARVFAQQLQFPSISLVPMDMWSANPIGTQSLSPHEPFMTWLKAAIVTGLVLSSPWVFFQIWMFVAAGLYPHEQKYVYLYLPISLGLFVFGVCLAFFFVFEPVLSFLFTFNASMGINPQVRIGEWLNFVLFLPLGFGIAFQLPLVMLFLNRIGIFSVEAYASKWRIAVMIIAVLSMLLTPADPISMLMLGLPLTLLYFFGIGLCKWMPKPTNPFGEAAETEA